MGREEIEVELKHMHRLENPGYVDTNSRRIHSYIPREYFIRETERERVCVGSILVG